MIGGRDAPGRNTVGVIGTLVWDTIHTEGGAAPVRDWGGIAYSLAAFEAMLPPTWTVLPIVKVGADLESEATQLFGGLSHVDSGAVAVVAEENNRVELRYQDAHERIETLSGGVPPWTFEELEDRIQRCDAIYANFISGFEMDLATSRKVKTHFGGCTYGDLHSLFLDIADDGTRMPCCPEGVQEWLGVFDIVQMNAAEAALAEDGGASLADIASSGLFITRGADGVSFEAVPELAESPPQWSAVGSPGGRSLRGRIPSDPHAPVVDPTGCGDVWGAACFAGLLSGLGLPAAAEQATRAAETALRTRGTGQLRAALASDGSIREGAL